MTPSDLPGPGLDAVRESTVDALCRHFAGDRLTMDDFERRVDLAHRASTRSQLAGLLADLPGDEVRPAPVAAEAAVAEPAGSRRGTPVVVALMGGNSRGGRWRPSERVVAVAVMGGVELDFREAIMEPGVTEVVVLALMGGVEIIVPPEIEVHTGGLAVMGGVEHKDDRPADSPTRSLPGALERAQRSAGHSVAGEPGRTARGQGTEAAATVGLEVAPSIRITGLALMGGVEIRTRDRGQRRSDR